MQKKSHRKIDKQEIGEAQMLLETATGQSAEAMKSLEEMRTQQKKTEKRKSSLIMSLQQSKSAPKRANDEPSEILLNKKA